MSYDVVCPKCDAGFTAETALDAASVAWPDLHWVWFQCPACSEHTHLEVRDGRIATINFIGAPGPDWKRIRVSSVDDLTVRADPVLLHCWLGESHLEFKARE